MSSKHAILGVLMQCPGHGYRIKKIFAPFISRDGLNDGQVYPILARLERDGLVRKEIVRQTKSPDKKIYHITDTGREEFLSWLEGSEDEAPPVKYDFFMQYDFLMKCNFFEHLTDGQKVEKLSSQIASSKEKLAEYRRVRSEIAEAGMNEYKLKIVDFGIEMQLLKIRWAQGLLKDELAQRGSTSGSSKGRVGAASKTGKKKTAKKG
jgi:DNA-binding PadR family transcriptional regulator